LADDVSHYGSSFVNIALTNGHKRVALDIGQHPGTYGQHPCDDFDEQRIENQKIQLQKYGKRGDIEGDYHIKNHHWQLEHKRLILCKLSTHQKTLFDVWGSVSQFYFEYLHELN
jgi:hypothetical protein